MASLCPTCHEPVDPDTGECPLCAVPVAPQGDALDERRDFYRRLVAATPQLRATRLLIGLNALVYLAMVATGVDWMRPLSQDLLLWGANFGPRTLTDQPWRLASSMFVHIGLIHLAFNMYALHALGQLVERLVGPVLFLLLYLTSGLAGSLASLWWNPQVLSAGASGAVFGVMGLLGGMLLRRSNHIPLSVARDLRQSVGMFLLYNLAFAVLVPNIDQAAHLGGLATGALAGLFVRGPLYAAATGASGRRAAANLVLLAALLAGLGIAWPTLRASRGSQLELLERFYQRETELVEEFYDAAQRHSAGRLPDFQFADLLERQLLPRWRAMREELAGRQLQRLLNPPLLNYAEAREESWEQLAKALREPNLERKREEFARFGELERRIQELLGPDAQSVE